MKQEIGKYTTPRPKEYPVIKDPVLDVELSFIPGLIDGVPGSFGGI